MAGPPNLTYGQVPISGQWNRYFSDKQDTLSYTPVNRAGDTMFGKLNILPPSTAAAGFNLAPGTAPAPPKDGDLWTTNTGLFAQVGGNTIGTIRNGNIAGPSVPVVSNIPTFSNTTGSDLQESGTMLPSGLLLSTTTFNAYFVAWLSAPPTPLPATSGQPWLNGGTLAVS
jgi:hypothetical protein